MPKPEVTHLGVLDMQVCVPESWDDERVILFADRENPAGTELGWFIRRQGDAALAGADERTPCAEYSDHVHITLDA